MLSTSEPESATSQPDSTAPFDPEAYFQRIGYTGERSATLETLQHLHYLHPQVIPFENLNPFLRIPVRLDLASLQQKLVMDGRGGYCYEQNNLLAHVLTALGFTVKGLAARVLWNLADGVTNPRTHMLLLVQVDGKPYIADVGFGGLTMTAPLALVPDRKQRTPHETFRLLKAGDEYVVEALVRQEWKALYQFGMDQQLLPDYELASWFLCNNPASRFLNEIIVARTTPDCRYALRNNELAIHHLNGETERKLLLSAAEVQAVLESVFQLQLPQPAILAMELDKLLLRLSAAEQPTVCHSPN